MQLRRHQDRVDPAGFTALWERIVARHPQLSEQQQAIATLALVHPEIMANTHTERGGTVVAITDAALSPLAATAAIRLELPASEQLGPAGPRRPHLPGAGLGHGGGRRLSHGRAAAVILTGAAAVTPRSRCASGARA